MNFEETIKALSDEIQKSLSPDSIIGSQIEIKGNIMIPVVQTGLGFGCGIGGGGTSAKDSGEGTGGGGGGGVTPASLILINDDGVHVLPLKPNIFGGALEKLMDNMPAFIEACKEGMGRKKKESDTE